MKTKRHPRNYFFGDSSAHFLLLWDADYAQPLAINFIIKQKRATLSLGPPLINPPWNAKQLPPSLLQWQPQLLTREGSAAHQVCVGEVEGGVEQEVGLDDPASLLTDVIEQAGTLQRDTALVAILGTEKGKERSGSCAEWEGGHGRGGGGGGSCTFRALRTVAPSNLSFGVWGDVLPL